jgi:lysophospholipase L1-like esterase
MRRSASVAGAAALAALAFVVLPSGVASASGAPYVSLGDSYVSGPLIPNQGSYPIGCEQSTSNYPHLTAAALGLQLTDMSCAGATSSNMSSPQSTTGGTNPPQLSPINASTRVVTISIGGNDINFSGIVENCAALTPWGPTLVGASCQGYYDPNGNDQLAAAINALAPRVAATLQQIHTLAPAASIFVVGYPAILPPSGACWPYLPFESGDAKYLQAKEVELNQMLQSAAAANGASYVDTYTPSENHSACAPESSRWVEPLIPGCICAPVHPNAAGEAGEALLLEAAMRARGIPVGPQPAPVPLPVPPPSA